MIPARASDAQSVACNSHARLNGCKRSDRRFYPGRRTCFETVGDSVPDLFSNPRSLDIEAFCVWQVFLAHLWQLSLAHLWQIAWTAYWDGDALCFGLERSGSPKYSAGIDQPIGLAFPFSTVRRKR